MGRLPDNYLGPKGRIALFKKDHALKGSIETETLQHVVGENLCITVKALVKVDGVIIATGHAFTSTPEEEKELEKAETTAIGRALVNAGYPEHSDMGDAEDVEEIEEKPKSKSIFKSRSKEPIKNEDSSDKDAVVSNSELEQDVIAENKQEASKPKKTFDQQSLLAKYSKK